MSVLEEARFENAYIVSLKQTSQQQFNLVWQSFGTRDLQQDHIQQFRTLRGYCPQSILTCRLGAGQNAPQRPKCHQGTTYYESCHHPFQGPDRSEL